MMKKQTLFIGIVGSFLNGCLGESRIDFSKVGTNHEKPIVIPALMTHRVNKKIVNEIEVQTSEGSIAIALDKKVNAEGKVQFVRKFVEVEGVEESLPLLQLTLSQEDGLTAELVESEACIDPDLDLAKTGEFHPHSLLESHEISKTTVDDQTHVLGTITLFSGAMGVDEEEGQALHRLVLTLNCSSETTVTVTTQRKAAISKDKEGLTTITLDYNRSEDLADVVVTSQ